MIRKQKPVVLIEPAEEEHDANAAVLNALAEQSKSLTDAIARAAGVLAMTIAKNKPAEGYLFTVQRDSKGNITSLVAKRGKNAG